MSDGQEIRSKRPMTLELDSRNNTRAKRPKPVPILSSPDLHRLALASPDVENFIKGSLQVSSSGQPTPVAAYIFPPKDPTVQQKQFVKGFEDALEECKRRGSLNPIPCEPLVSCGTTTLTTLTSANLESLNVQNGTVASSQSSNMSSVETHSSDTSDSMSMPMTSVKDEQTVPNGVDPIDMRDQEKLKLERKRLRNRIAASKCRRKKLERITQLEDQVNKLKSDNQEYEKMISMLRQEIDTLHQEAVMHRQHGCHIEVQNL
ncbi:transcription factor AP-1-like [Tropilaelaps mercedesae]|uniref:Transcription factor AP-1-like n=1 Tax=Tropilaelaps mercedesae TaxID=418985 RepID=A0A1V9XA05_9ACAR|nr:transcription factor AP-1-like [Tropilaelaps mercedesae]